MKRKSLGQGPASFAVALVLVFTACGSQVVEAPGSVFNPTEVFISSVRQKADELAKAELAKFNAAEEQYKTQVSREENPVNPNPFREGVGTYMKWYRHFTGSKIVDIRRTDSLLNPMAIVIVYDCELMATNSFDEDSKDAFLNIDPVKNAEKETQFNIQRTVKFTREYLCDGQGKYVGNLPEVPDRGIFYVQGDEMQRFQSAPMR
jgi:hypothetical protein